MQKYPIFMVFLILVALVECTFPLQFAEVVLGDVKTTGRQIISTTKLLPFGKKNVKSHLIPPVKNGCDLPPEMCQQMVQWCSR